jgi:hypothetical protein
MSVLSGGMMTPNISIGVASLDFGTGEFNYLGKKGNSFLTNLGYAFGAMANLQDIVAGINGISATYQAEKGSVPHARLKGDGTAAADVDVSVAAAPGANPNYKYDGPNKFTNTLDYAQAWAFYISKGEHYASHGAVQGLKIPLHNVNGKILTAITRNIKNGRGLWNIGGLKYGTSIFGCQSHVAHALWSVGIPTLPINLHPLILWGQLAIRQVGISASPFLIYKK